MEEGPREDDGDDERMIWKQNRDYFMWYILSPSPPLLLEQSLFSSPPPPLQHNPTPLFPVHYTDLINAGTWFIKTLSNKWEHRRQKDEVDDDDYDIVLQKYYTMSSLMNYIEITFPGQI